MKKTIFLATSVCVLFFASCNKSTDSTTETTETEATAEVVTEEAPVAEVAEITLKGGDDMKYDQTTLNAKAGQTVKLTLEHSGKLPKESMGHNFVLLKAGVNETDFAAKALGAKDTDYIPAELEGDIIAHTDLIGGGESTTIEFTAPEAGSYTYICTFPGHAAMMKGTLEVE